MVSWLVAALTGNKEPHGGGWNSKRRSRRTETGSSSAFMDDPLFGVVNATGPFRRIVR
jgi:hypothetical protein